MYKMGNTEPISPTRLGEHCLVLRKTNSVWPLWLSYTMSVTLKNVLGTLCKTFSLPDLVIISQLSTLQTVSVFHKVICSHKTWASLWVPAEWRFYFSSRASIKSSHIKNWRRRRNERIAKKTDLISKTKTLNLQHAFWCIYLPSPHHKRCQISSEWQCHRSLNFISAIIVSSTLQRPSPLRFRRKDPAVESLKY